MALIKLGTTWLLMMFLLAPKAWGESAEDLSHFVRSVNLACTETVSAHLEKWRGISPANRKSLTVALCEDDRVLWPIAENRLGEVAVEYEMRFRNRNHYGPLLIGLIGSSPREASEVMHAIRSLLFPGSRTLFEWSKERAKLRAWQADHEGGKFGGVMYVSVEGADTERRLYDQIRAATDAMTFALAYHMDSYVLVVSTEHDVRASFPAAGDPIRWIQFESDCVRRLRW